MNLGKLKNASFGREVRSLQLCETSPNLAAVKLVSDRLGGALHAILLHQGICKLLISLPVLKTHLMLLSAPLMRRASAGGQVQSCDVHLRSMQPVPQVIVIVTAT